MVSAVFSLFLAASGMMAQDLFLSPHAEDGAVDKNARCDYGWCDHGADPACQLWGTDIHCVVDSCPAYEHCYNYDGHVMYDQPARNLCEYGVCDGFSSETNTCAFYGKGDVHCMVSSCPPQWEGQCWTSNGQTYYWDNVLHKPTHLRVCLDLLYSADGGSKGFYDEKFTIGSSSSSSISHDEKRSMSSKVATDISENEIFEKMDISTELQSAFESTSSEVFTQSEHEESVTTIHIDLSKPAYYYRTKVTIGTYHGDTVELLGGSQIVKNKPIASDKVCGNFDLLR